MKVKGPLYSEKAQGTISDVLTFSFRKTGQQVRYQKKQKDTKTLSQLEQREKFLTASLACRFMDYGTATFGVALYGNQKIENYHLCIANYLLCRKS